MPVDVCKPIRYAVGMEQNDQIQKKEYFSVAEIAKILGISRTAVHKRIKSGTIKPIRIGTVYAISADALPEILKQEIDENKKREIDVVVKRVINEYGQTLRMLGKE